MPQKVFIKMVLLFILFAMAFGCSKKVDVTMPEHNNLDAIEAVRIVTETVDKYSQVPDMKYKEIMSSSNSASVVHVWETDKNRAYYIRYWSFDGTDLRVQLQRNESATEYYVALRNNGGDAGDCYGYSHSMPVSKGMKFDVYWSDFGNQGCRSVIRYTIPSKEEALLFAGALQYMFIDHKVEDVLYDADHAGEDNNVIPADEKVDNKTPEKEVESKVETKSSEIQKKSCSVEKILKMQEIGLTVQEIKRLCN